MMQFVFISFCFIRAQNWITGIEIGIDRNATAIRIFPLREDPNPDEIQQERADDKRRGRAVLKYQANQMKNKFRY